MPRQRTGYVWYWKERKSWYARLTFTDASGKRRNVCRSVENKTEGNKLLKQLIRDLEDNGEKALDSEKLTFRQLAKLYSDRKLIAAEYQGDTKVRGLRSHKNQQGYLKTLVDHFGGLRVRAITHSDLEDYRAKRLQTITRRGAQLSAASVNRELSLMRAVLNFARRQGWLSRNPFDAGDPVIKPADEVKRERVLTFEEEGRLLLACAAPREHLRPMLIFALDTGLRKSEMLALRWADVDLESGMIRARSSTTKTRKARTIGMTSRLKAELERMRESAGDDPESRIFNQKDMKRSFATACELAGVENLHWHDLRHTATTRMVEVGLAPMIVMKLTGHTQMATFARYVNANDEAATKGAEALDAYRQNALGESTPERIN
ncbi:MAG TPA: site-specific integrase [Blastocatellia bacterium]|nr:site-specific integrase [Blastocatellia bacterium]HMX24849.1 site-specific integrase [Blastocatellia bacterium]HMY70889.1 site-specific integrase [Blastocatellia bacterium]HMZ22862.1 site-specific integrase [Blastocatellia bacterium]HNG29982.1 site-specific integrase [Blastocatellia bacterium]